MGTSLSRPCGALFFLERFCGSWRWVGGFDWEVEDRHKAIAKVLRGLIVQRALIQEPAGDGGDIVTRCIGLIEDLGETCPVGLVREALVESAAKACPPLLGWKSVVGGPRIRQSLLVGARSHRSDS